MRGQRWCNGGKGISNKGRECEEHSDRGVKGRGSNAAIVDPRLTRKEAEGCDRGTERIDGEEKQKDYSNGGREGDEGRKGGGWRLGKKEGDNSDGIRKGGWPTTGEAGDNNQGRGRETAAIGEEKERVDDWGRRWEGDDDRGRGRERGRRRSEKWEGGAEALLARSEGRRRGATIGWGEGQ